MFQTNLICPGLLAVVLLLAGCSSVLTTASLRDLMRGGDEHASEAGRIASDAREEDPADSPSEANDDASGGAAADVHRRQAAVGEATRRLAKLGHLDAAAQATLAETLDRTEQEDWPAVIEAFAETLAAAAPPAIAVPEPTPEAEAGAPVSPAPVDTHVTAKAELDAEPAPATADLRPAVPAPVVDTATPPLIPSPLAGEPSVPVRSSTTADDDASAANTLTVQNACFAARVQAWGVVDRFPVDRFRPGQELIVYFELEGLSAGTSPAGHTTCIDTTLQLVAADGRRLHDWSFEPIAETCRSRRHDYFARYVIRLPDQLPAGACRIDVQVTDTIGSLVAEASLPLEIQPTSADR